MLAAYNFSVTDDAGNALENVEIEVRHEMPGQPLAPLFSDRLGANPLGNPFVAADGRAIRFHIAGGSYQITATKDGFVRTWRYVAIGTMAEHDLADFDEIQIVQQVLAGYALRFEVETSSPPGAGAIRFNHADLSQATAAYVSNVNYAGSEIVARLLEMFDSQRGRKDSFILSNPSAGTQASFVVTDATAEDGFVELEITGHNGEATFSVGPVNFQRELVGDDGPVVGPDESVDGELALWSGTDGDELKRATTTGILKATAGVLAAAEEGDGNAIVAPATAEDAGKVELATVPEVRSAATGDKALVAAHIESASAAVALTDAATVALDWDSGINFTLTVEDDRVLGNPTNGQPGTYRTVLVQGNDATERELTFGNQYGGSVPELDDIDNEQWYLLTIRCITATHFIVAAIDASAP